MKKIILSLIVSSTTLLTACMAAKVTQLPPRTPLDLLLDIKAVADSDDLTKIDFVGNRLRIDLSQGPEKPIFNTDGTTIIGYGSDVEQNGLAKEYRLENFQYGIFQPKNRAFQRVIVSLSINSAVICVRPSDLTEAFDHIKRYANPDISSLEYSYEHSKYSDIKAYFRFEKDGCLFKFGFFQNSNK